MRDLAIVVVGGAIIGAVVAWAFGFDPISQAAAVAVGAGLGAGTRIWRKGRQEKGPPS